LRKYRDSFEYAAVMTNSPGEVIARIGGTDRVVSSIQRNAEAGYLILLPAVDWSAPYDEKQDDDLEEADEKDQWLPEFGLAVQPGVS
jgi:hypothetical protein